MDHKTLAQQFLENKDYNKYFYHAKQQYTKTNSEEDLKACKKAQRMKETYDELQKFLKIPKDDYYKILQVSSTNLSDLRTNYKKLSKQFHPDTSKIPECNEAFYRIQTAYAVLSDDNKRREYDQRQRMRRVMPPSTSNYNMFIYEMARRRNSRSFDDFETIFRPEYYVYSRNRRVSPDVEVEGLKGVALIIFIFIFLIIAML